MYWIGTLFIILAIFYGNTANGIDIGYPTVAQAGFHHNALLYIDGDHSPEKLMLWLTDSYEFIESRNVIFDTITLIAENTLSGASTAYSTNKQDWTWLLETKLFSTYGVLSNLTHALNQLDKKNKTLRVIIMIPYIDSIGQQNFSLNMELISSKSSSTSYPMSGYAFASPLMQGIFNAGRLRATAKLAQQYGLGVEIESHQGSSTDYEIALLQNYLAQGYIDGYQYVPTAYFLGNYESVARSQKACDLLQKYTSSICIEPTCISNAKWSWTKNPNIQAKIGVSSDMRPGGIRINWSPKHKYWFGRVVVEGFIAMNNNSIWKMLSSTEIGAKTWRDEDWPSTLLPFSLLPLEKILSIRVVFIGSSWLPSLANEDLIIEQIPNGIALQASTGAPYRISPSMFSYNPQYGDTTMKTLSNFSRGLLTDDQWSNGQWEPTMSVDWLDNTYTHSYIRIALDFTAIMNINEIIVRLHGGSYGSINWLNTARLLVSSDCVPFSSYSSSDCTVKSYPCTDRIITGSKNTDQGGLLLFKVLSSFRWATLEFQPNAWLMIDEVQAFVNGNDISHLVNYYFLTPPTSKPVSSSDGAYLDDGVRLNDGAIVGVLGPITGWMKSELRTITIDLLINGNIRETSVWALIKPDWAISPPRSVIVSTSLDGIKWILFGQQGQMQLGERMLDAQHLFITTANSTLTRYIKFDFVIDEVSPGWWTMVPELTATKKIVLLFLFI
ncbi:unnamed protein product [Rotaria socialis]